MGTRPMTAWLIMWEWIGDHAAVAQPYVDIVTFRKNVPYIKEYLQRLHDLKCLTLTERISTSRYNNPSRPPNEPTVHRSAHGIEVHCGHNPFLVAKPVRNLVVETDPATGEETVTWSPYLSPEERHDQ